MSGVGWRSPPRSPSRHTDERICRVASRLCGTDGQASDEQTPQSRVHQSSHVLPQNTVRGSAFIGLPPTIRPWTQARLRSPSGLPKVLWNTWGHRALAWHPRCMPLVALTGGIASGKSTIARRLAEHGAVIVDADQVVRDVQQPGSPC